MIGKDNETMIEKLVTGLKRQDLSNAIEQYSDCMVENHGAKSFDEFCSSITLEQLEDTNDLIQFEICNAIKDLIIPKEISVEDATDEQRGKVVDLSNVILGIINGDTEEEEDEE